MTTAVAPEPTLAPANPDDIGFDRELGMMLARVPFTAIGWAALAWLASLAWAQLFTITESVPNCGALVVISIGMLLAAFIDGYAFKVPNWLTLSLVVSGWYVGLLNDLDLVQKGSLGTGGIGYALLGTALGFLMLFPALFIGGMGQGDVKMTMAFGSWMGAFFGAATSNTVGDGGTSGPGALWWSFAIGVIVGGIFGIVMMALRRDLHKNVQNFRAIAGDLQSLMTEGPAKCAERANARRKDWVRLPYGVPLCVGFLGFLFFRIFYTF